MRAGRLPETSRATACPGACIRLSSMVHSAPSLRRGDVQAWRGTWREPLWVLSGPVAAGKSSWREARKPNTPPSRSGRGCYFSSGSRLAAALPEINERRALQEFGQELDDRDGGSWLAEDVQVAAEGDVPLVVIDSVRVVGQIEALRLAAIRSTSLARALVLV